MIRLSVNVNKVATLRNSRGGATPSVLEAVEVCVAAGAPGITVHPRADRRHITPEDVRDIARVLRDSAPAVEYNIEGDPRPELLDLVEEVRPISARSCRSRRARSRVRPAGSPVRRAPPFARRSSVCTRAAFASACSSTPSPIRSAGPRRSAPIASSSTPSRSRAPSSAAPTSAADRSRSTPDAARLAHSLGLGVNAGHDLDLANLVIFRELPFLDEVSIGHAIMSRALFVGLSTVVREYLAVLAGAGRCSVIGAHFEVRYDRRPSRNREIDDGFNSMKSDAVAFGIAGVLFGLIAGWIIGSQQATTRPPSAVPAVPGGERAGERRFSPRHARRRARRDAGERAQVGRRARRVERHAARRSSATSTSTPSATTMRSSGTARR